MKHLTNCLRTIIVVIGATLALIGACALSQEGYQYALTLVASELDEGESLGLQVNPTLDPVGNLNTARHLHTATLLPNGLVLVTGGYTGDPAAENFGVTSSSELYDPATQIWH